MEDLCNQKLRINLKFKYEIGFFKLMYINIQFFIRFGKKLQNNLVMLNRYMYISMNR